MTEPGPFFFKTRKAARSEPRRGLSAVGGGTSDRGGAYLLRSPLEVERSPTPLVDGGVFAVNPAMSAFAEVVPLSAHG